MSLTDDISREIRSLSRQYDNACARNAEIDRKIESLESARQWVKLARRSAEDARNAIKKFDMPSRWSGRDKDSFEGDLEGTLKTRSDKYVSQIKELDGEIGREIWNLRLKKDYFASLIQSAEKGIESLKRDLLKASS